MKQFSTIFNKPLLLRQEALEQISAFIAEGNFDSLASSRTEREIHDAESISYTEGNTGVVEISGIITYKGSWWSWIFGETPINMITQAIKGFLEKPSITRILLLLDSPGGFVDGVKELSDFIFENRAKKEIVALADPMACSAGYWIGSSASKFYISSPLSEVGSIGVYKMHQDISEALGKAGVKITEISSGKYKTLGSPYKPLDEKAIELLGESVFYTHDLFVEAVMRNRGLSKDEAKALADGRVYFGSKAVNLKLVDGIMHKEKIEKQEDNLAEEAMTEEEEEMAQTEEDEKKAESEDEEEKASSEEDEDEDEKAFRKKHPALCKKMIRSGIRLGAKAERERILEIQELTNEGFEELAKTYIQNGKSANMFASHQLKEIKTRGGMTLNVLRETRNQKPSFTPAPKEKASGEVSAFQDELVKVAEGIGKQLAADNTFKLN